jgi:histidinol phosphatase-like PHP family hydrolase
MTDLHVHSVLSGDAIDDIGILSAAAKSKGYNALFLTDHQAAGNFPISTVVANHAEFDDSLGSKWDEMTFGDLLPAGVDRLGRLFL